jgi:O-methyltransferase
VAHCLHRRLLVFDSFEGLPSVSGNEGADHHPRQSAPCVWKAGACSASLDVVQRNVASYGEPAACVFVRGWFSDTLNASNLPSRVALAYTDVVLPSSARTCLAALWPRVSDGGIYFSRDLALTNAWMAMADPEWWRQSLAEDRPMIFGVGFGLSDASPYLGFLIKGLDPPGAYLDRLRVFKPGAEG